MILDKNSFLAGVRTGVALGRKLEVNDWYFVGLKVVVRPDKLYYANGERIDPTGIRCLAVRPDGSVADTPHYPGGEIPMSELSFPVEYADASLASNRSVWTDDEPTYVGGKLAYTKLRAESVGMTVEDYDAHRYEDGRVATVYRQYYGQERWGEWSIGSSSYDGNGTLISGTQRIAYVGGKSFLLACAVDPAVSFRHCEVATNIGVSSYATTGGTPGWSHQFTHNGKTVGFWGGLDYYEDWFQQSLIEASTIVNVPETAWMMVYGNLLEKIEQRVPVLWTPPFPGNPTRTTTFNIFIS